LPEPSTAKLVLFSAGSSADWSKNADTLVRNLRSFLIERSTRAEGVAQFGSSERS